MAVAYRASNLSTIRPAEFLQRHGVFVRRARDASHQAFFFLGLLEEPLGTRAKNAVDGYRRFALSQIRTLVREVKVPDDYERLERGLAAGSVVVLDATQKEIEKGVRLYQRWRAISDHLQSLRSVDVAALRKDLEAFLVDSRVDGFLKRLEVHALPALLNYLRKNLALLWAAFLVLAVSLKVEAVNSLLLNEQWTLLLPLAFFALPLSAGRLVPWLLRSRYGRPPAWDLGGPAFRSLGRQAVEPARLIHRWPPHDKTLCMEIFRAQVMKLLTYAGWWLVALACLCILLWIGKVGGSTVTVFLVLSHFYALLILARTLDFWDFLDPRPVRFLLLLGAMVLLIALLAGVGREAVIVASLSAAVIFPLVSRRRGFLRLVLPFCLIALAGANYVGKKTLDREVWREDGAKWKRLGRSDWPWPAAPGSGAPVVLMAASGGGSRAAVYTGLTLQQLQRDRPEIAEQLQAISSVSGGSLATAAYISRLLETAPSDSPAVRRKDRERNLADLAPAVQSDFLLPTLFGTLLPGRTRGSAIEREWRSGPVGLHDHRLSELAKGWEWCRRVGCKVPPFPMPLFNSSTLDGHDVVISPLSKELYTRPGLDDEASDPERNAYQQLGEGDDAPTWVYYRDGVYGLEDLLDRFDPLLSSSVRASANFPFGFPLVRLKTTRPLFFSPLRRDRQEGEKLVRLTDGGALSNSGMWSLFNLLMRDDNLRRLKERGVLLLLVEASRMPSYRQLDQAVNSLWGTIGDQGPVGQRLHREMLEMLERTYGDRIAVVQLDLVPRESYNVFTTWALDHGSLGQLRKSFDERWQVELGNLDLSWAQLTGSVPPSAPGTPGRAPYIARKRPPLD